MKKRVLVSLLSSSLLIVASPVFADENISSASGTATVEFETDDSPNPPVDPTNPDKPDPIDPVDPTNPGTGNAGPLSIDKVSNIDFGRVLLSGSVATYSANNGHPYIQVTDKRGQDDGWILTAQMDGFKTVSGKLLEGAELSFINGTVRTQTGNPSPMPTLSNLTLASGAESKTVLSAAVGEGAGLWVADYSGTANANENVQLKVIGGTAKTGERYTATINWELTSAP